MSGINLRLEKKKPSGKMSVRVAPGSIHIYVPHLKLSRSTREHTARIAEEPCGNDVKPLSVYIFSLLCCSSSLKAV